LPYFGSRILDIGDIAFSIPRGINLVGNMVKGAEFAKLAQDDTVVTPYTEFEDGAN
jgi:hypothetical protein